jgi:hypothetical protein
MQSCKEIWRTFGVAFVWAKATVPALARTHRILKILIVGERLGQQLAYVKQTMPGFKAPIL